MTHMKRRRAHDTHMIIGRPNHLSIPIDKFIDAGCAALDSAYFPFLERHY